MTAISDVISAAGWNPVSPSAECLSVTAFPETFSRLKADDAVRAHHLVIYCEYARHFRRESWKPDDAHRAFWAAALVRSLLSADPDRELDVQTAQSEVIAMDKWFADFYVPRQKAYERAQLEHGKEYVWAHAADFEPVLTMAAEDERRGFYDVDRDLREMAVGIAMHNASAIERIGKVAKIDLYTLIQSFQWATEDGTKLVSDFDPSGAFVVDAKKVKTALDSRNPDGPGLNADLVEKLPTPGVRAPSGVPELLIATEAAGALRAFLRAESAKPASSLARKWVLKHFEDLATEVLTFRALAEESKIPVSTLNDAFLKIRAEVRHGMGGTKEI